MNWINRYTTGYQDSPGGFIVSVQDHKLVSWELMKNSGCNCLLADTSSPTPPNRWSRFVHISSISFCPRLRIFLQLFHFRFWLIHTFALQMYRWWCNEWMKPVLKMNHQVGTPLKAGYNDKCDYNHNEFKWSLHWKCTNWVVSLVCFFLLILGFFV